MSPRELEKSPKGAREVVTRPSTVEHVDMQEVAAEGLTKTFDVEVLVGSNVETLSLVFDGEFHADNSQEIVSLQ